MPQADLSQWDGSIYDLERVGVGGTALVFAVDRKRVVKVPIPSPFGLQAFEQERAVYRLLLGRLNQQHMPYVLSCYNPEHEVGILLERCEGSVRDRLRWMRQGDDNCPAIGSKEAYIQAGKWAYQAAQGLACLHNCKIIQADVGCHNMLLDRHNNLKLADFSGSSIEGTHHQALVIYDLRSRLSNTDEPDRLSDLYALGCALYEMATGRLPWHDRADREVQRKVQRRLSQREFPRLEGVRKMAPRLADAIEGCWHVKTPGGFKSAEQVVEVLGQDVRYLPADKSKLHVNYGYQPVVGTEKPAAHDSSRNVSMTKKSKSSHRHKKHPSSSDYHRSSRKHTGSRSHRHQRSVDDSIEQHRSNEGYYRGTKGGTADKVPERHSFFSNFSYNFFQSMKR